MMTLARLLGSLALLALGSCTVIPIPEPVDSAKLDQWVQQQQYTRAIRALERQAYSSPASRQQLAQLRQQASAYDKQQAHRVLALQQDDNWREAFSLLYDSMQNYAEGEQLQQAEQTLLHRQTLRKKQLQAQVLLAKAEWLLRNHAMHREIVHIDPDNFSAELQLSYARTQLLDIATELYDYGMHAQANNDLELADHCLTMSFRINPQIRTSQALAELGRIQEQQQRRQQEQQAQHLLGEIREALAAADLALANQLLKQADKIDGFDQTNREITELRNSLKHAIAARVAELLRQGDAHYSNGEVEQAQQIWAQALSLDPENRETLERIERAQRVLDKLKQLKQTKQHS